MRNHQRYIQEHLILLKFREYSEETEENLDSNKETFYVRNVLLVHYLQ